MYNQGNQYNQSSNDQRPSASGLTDIEGARAVARRLFDTYDRDRNGTLDNVEVVPMIVDVYKSFNRIFSPSRGDIDSFFKILDRNGDGKISQQDVEELCVKYLTNQTQTQLRGPTDNLTQTRSYMDSKQQQPYNNMQSRGSGYQATYDQGQAPVSSYRRPQM